jgi:type 1 fimbria pilin
MMKRKLMVGTALLGLAALAVPAGWAWANHVRIEVSGETVAPPPGVIYVPPAGTTVVVPSMPQTLRADEIKAQQVRAQTIYANKIEADEVHGVIYQTRSVKIGDTKGDIRAPEVSASVIYADEIKANSVVADAIYVRSLHRR